MLVRSFAWALVILFAPQMALAEVKFALQSDVDHVWTMLAAGLVLMMQAGFMLLEAGSVRTKNSVNVAQKNLIDFLVSGVCYGAIGYSVMFGISYGGWFGWSSGLAFFNFNDDWELTFFVFQLMFCGTAATVVSGAVAERMTMPAYILATVMIALVLYPVVGHWAWGGLLNGQSEPWLAAMGFMDFAGGTVVHSVGAWVGLAAIFVIGARKGRFDADGNPVQLHGHSPFLATVGLIIIWVGWIGFNGGSTTAGTSGFAVVVANTMVSAGVAGVTAMLISWRFRGYMTPAAAINGVLAGLVVVTPGCDVLTGSQSMLLGVMAGVLVLVSETVFERVFKLDDPLGAVSVHGVVGAFGTVMLAVLAKPEMLLAESRLEQIMVQLVGVVSVFAWTFGLSFVVFKLVSLAFSPDGRRSGLRVSEECEDIGLNVTEHKSPMGTGILQAALVEIARESDKDFEPLVLERGDEAYEMSLLINKIMGDLHAAISDIEESVRVTAGGDFSHRIELDKFTGAPRRLCAGMNEINAICNDGLTLMQDRLDQLAQGDLTTEAFHHGPGQLGDMGKTIQHTMETLYSTLFDIAEAAEKAKSNGNRLANSAEHLSAAGRAQMITLEQAIPVLEEVQEIAGTDSDKARVAAELCTVALGRAEHGMSVAGKTVAGIQAIDGAVEAIQASVSLIDDIARQINLLAINAGIEAARVGKSNVGGNGFAVLAKEVRALADTTANTVHQIRDSASQVVEAAEGGRSGVDALSDSLTVILEDLAKAADLSKDVASAGVDQASRIKSVADRIGTVREDTRKSAELTDQNAQIANRVVSDAAATAQKLTAFKLGNDTRPGRMAA